MFNKLITKDSSSKIHDRNFHKSFIEIFKVKKKLARKMKY